MKKFLSLCLMTMVGATMAASELPFTVDPESGSSLEVLESITIQLKSDSGYDWIDINSEATFFKRNGEIYSAFELNQSASDITKYVFIPEIPVTEPGVYEVYFEDYAVNCGNELGSLFYENTEPIVFTYTVGDGGETPSELPFTVTEPEPGSTVSGIYYVSLELDQESGYKEFIVNNEEGIYFTKDDEIFCGANCQPQRYILMIDPEQFITAAGEYALVIEEGAISWTDGENTVDNAVKLVYNYTVEETEPVEFPFEVTPAVGSTVSSISEVVLKLKPDSGYTWMYLDSYSVGLMKDSEFMEGWSLNVYQDPSDETSYTLTIVETIEENGEEKEIPATITEPGTYEIVIDEWGLECGNADDDNPLYYYNTSVLSFSYTIKGGETPSELPFTVTDPKPGSTISELKYVMLELNKESGYTSFVINNEKGIYFTQDGKLLYAAVCMPDELSLEIDPEKPIVGAGKYALVIEEGALAWTDGENTVSNSEELVYAYTVEGGGEVKLPFDVIPAPGQNVASLSEITLKLIPESGYTSMYVDKYAVSIKKDSEFAGIIDVSQNPDDPGMWVLTIVNENDEPTPITEPGTYELIIDTSGLYCTNADWSLFYTNDSPLSFTYTVTPPVEYDLLPTNYKPADGAEIDFEERDFSSVTLTVGEGIMPAEDAVAYIVPVGYEEEGVEAKIRKVSYMPQLIIEFEPMEYNGEYEVYIPEASFGDEAWIADPNTGHANPEITLHYTLINAKERESAVSYTLEPEVAWSTDLKTFTLKFEDGIKAVAFACATLSCTETKYSKYAEFVDNGDSTFTVEFDEAPTEGGKYLFMVESGMFGNAEYIESDEESGIANAAVERIIEVTPVGILSVATDDAAAPVFNMLGVKIADSIKNLPAGIYIVNGKKVVVR